MDSSPDIEKLKVALAADDADGQTYCKLTPTPATTGSMRLTAPGPILEAGGWAHARRPFFALADIEARARRKAEGEVAAPISPLALEAVRRIDQLSETERGINGRSATARRAVRQELSGPLVEELEASMRAERPLVRFVRPCRLKRHAAAPT